MKRIGLLISTLNGGGAERVVSHLSHILSEEYDVHIVLFEDTYMEYEVSGQIHNLDIPAKNGSVFVKLRILAKRVQRLRELKRKEKLDCVISFLDSPNFVNLLSGSCECRKIISIRNYSGFENRQNGLGKLTNLAMKLIYRRADHIVAVSEQIRQDFCQHYGIPEKKISTIYNPYNFEQMAQMAEEALSESEAEFFSGHFVFVNVGRIMYQKGIWHLLKAFSLVYRENNDARLVLVGEDLSHGEVESLICDLGLEDEVLMPGRSRNPYKYMKHANVYVLSSMFEGFPNAMVEGMACGCAVIAADCKSGPREILYQNADISIQVDQISEADYGILVPPLEKEENWDYRIITDGEKKMAEAMLCITDESVWYKKAAARSRNFDFEAAKKRFVTVIESLG